MCVRVACVAEFYQFIDLKSGNLKIIFREVVSATPNCSLWDAQCLPVLEQQAIHPAH